MPRFAYAAVLFCGAIGWAFLSACGARSALEQGGIGGQSAVTSSSGASAPQGSASGAGGSANNACRRWAVDGPPTGVTSADDTRVIEGVPAIVSFLDGTTSIAFARDKGEGSDDAVRTHGSPWGDWPAPLGAPETIAPQACGPLVSRAN